HWRPVADVHAREQRGRMNDECQAGQSERGPSERLVPNEPREDDQYPRDDVESRALKEGVEMIHPRFEPDLRLIRVRDGRRVLLLVLGDGSVKGRNVVGPEGLECPLHRPGRRKAHRERFQEFVARERPCSFAGFLLSAQLTWPVTPPSYRSASS